MKNKSIKIKRAIYGWGRFDLKPELREYTIVGSGVSTVGTIEEIRNHLKCVGYRVINLEIEDANGVIVVNNINLNQEVQ